MPQDPFDTTPINIRPTVNRFGRKPDDPNLVRYSEMQNRPSILSDPEGWWGSHSDNEKQAILDSIGEFSGGTVGAVAGGGTPASIVGAGVGAAGGKAIARLAGRAAGLKPTPRTAGQEALDLAETGAVNAAGEGVGRAVAYGAKKLAGAAARGLLKPDPAKLKLAEDTGTALTPGMLSEGEVPKMVERTLAKLPGGSEPIRKATVAASGAAQQRVEGAIAGLGPNLSDQTVGQSLQDARKGIVSSAQGQFRKLYGNLSRDMGDVTANPIRYNQSAREILDSIARDKISIPSPTRDLLHRAAHSGQSAPKQLGIELSPEARSYIDTADQVAKSLGGGSYMALDADGKKLVENIVEKSGQVKPDLTGTPKLAPQDAPLTAAELVELRTQLLQQQRKITSTSPSLDKRAIPALVDGIDQSIEESLTGAGKTNTLAAWRDTNQKYSKFMRQYFGTPNPERPEMGNAAARTIQRAAVPERAISTDTQSAVQGTQAATDPSRMADVGLKPLRSLEDPTPALRRNRGEDLLQRSRTQNRYLGDDRYVSPGRLEKLYTNEPGTQELINPGSQRPLTKPATDLEQGIELGKAAASPLRIDNSSGTAVHNQYLNLAKGVGTGVGTGLATAAISPGDVGTRLKHGAIAGVGGATGSFVLPRLAAKAWTGEALRNALVGKAPSPTGVVPGMFGRLAGDNLSPIPPRLKSLEEPEKQDDPFATTPIR